MVGFKEFNALNEEVVAQGVLQKEIYVQLKALNVRLENIPCAGHSVQLKWLERITIGSICFSGSIILTIIANFEKIKKVFIS